MVLRNILASIGIGLLATTSPCVFPLYPGYLAYLSASGDKTEIKKKNQYFLGFFCSTWRAGDDAYSRSSNLIAFFIYR